MTARPSIVPVLDTSGANRVTWGAGKEGVGYAFEDPVPFGEYNYGLKVRDRDSNVVIDMADDGTSSSEELWILARRIATHVDEHIDTSVELLHGL